MKKLKQKALGVVAACSLGLGWSAVANAGYDDLSNGADVQVADDCWGITGSAFYLCAAEAYWWLGNDFTSGQDFEHASYCYLMAQYLWSAAGSGGS